MTLLNALASPGTSAAAPPSLHHRFGIEKVHQFDDGRTVVVRSYHNRAGQTRFCMVVANEQKNFLWEDSIGHQSLDECVWNAEQLFQIKHWNVL